MHFLSCSLASWNPPLDKLLIILMGLCDCLFSPSGLGLLVTWLSDPDNLNQLVVNQLDMVTPKGSVEELCGSDLDLASLASQEGEGNEV